MAQAIYAKHLINNRLTETKNEGIRNTCGQQKGISFS